MSVPADNSSRPGVDAVEAVAPVVVRARLERLTALALTGFCVIPTVVFAATMLGGPPGTRVFAAAAVVPNLMAWARLRHGSYTVTATEVTARGGWLEPARTVRRSHIREVAVAGSQLRLVSARRDQMLHGTSIVGFGVGAAGELAEALDVPLTVVRGNAPLTATAPRSLGIGGLRPTVAREARANDVGYVLAAGPTIDAVSVGAGVDADGYVLRRVALTHDTARTLDVTHLQRLADADAAAVGAGWVDPEAGRVVGFDDPGLITGNIERADDATDHTITVGLIDGPYRDCTGPTAGTYDAGLLAYARRMVVRATLTNDVALVRAGLTAVGLCSPATERHAAFEAIDRLVRSLAWLGADADAELVAGRLRADNGGFLAAYTDAASVLGAEAKPRQVRFDVAVAVADPAVFMARYNDVIAGLVFVAPEIATVDETVADLPEWMIDFFAATAGSEPALSPIDWAVKVHPWWRGWDHVAALADGPNRVTLVISADHADTDLSAFAFLVTAAGGRIDGFDAWKHEEPAP